MTREIFFVRQTWYLSFIWGVHITKAYTNPQKDFVSSLKYIYQKRGLHKFNKNDFCSGNNLCIMCSTHPNINCILSINESYDNIAFEFGIMFLFQDLVDVITRQLASSRKKHKDLKCNWKWNMINHPKRMALEGV